MEALRNASPVVDSLKETEMRIVCDADEGGKIVQDDPVSFSQVHRRYGYRMTSESMIRIGDHDPMKKL